MKKWIRLPLLCLSKSFVMTATLSCKSLSSLPSELPITQLTTRGIHADWVPGNEQPALR
jgi:hypothetical protein